MEGVPAFLVRKRIAPVAVREGLAKHHALTVIHWDRFNRYDIHIVSNMKDGRILPFLSIILLQGTTTTPSWKKVEPLKTCICMFSLQQPPPYTKDTEDWPRDDTTALGPEHVKTFKIFIIIFREAFKKCISEEKLSTGPDSIGNACIEEILFLIPPLPLQFGKRYNIYQIFICMFNVWLSWALFLRYAIFDCKSSPISCKLLH